jgi:RNA polymerase sigma factor (sigma-70 family)
MNSTNISHSSASSTSSTTSPAQRIGALHHRIYSIAHRFQLSDQTDDDIAHYMIERLLTRCADDPSFINRDDGYWLRYAKWMGYHLLQRTIIYNRFTSKETMIALKNSDPDELSERITDLDPEANPEKAYELEELRKVINSLPPHNRKLAAMLMIGYTKSEVADAIGISRPAVSQRLSTIKKVLSPIS